MSQHYCSASSRCLIFYAIISVLIFQVVARHRFNHNNLLREQEKRGRPFENLEKGFPKLMKLFFLKPSAVDRHKSEQQLNQDMPLLYDDIKINTSCGRINCENVPNYPSELIKELLAEQTPGTLPDTIPADADYEDMDKFENSYDTGESEEPEITRAITTHLGRSFNPSSWHYPNEYPNEDNLPRTEYECKVLADRSAAEQEEKFSEERGRDNQEICRLKLRETQPKETIDEHYQPVTLVNNNDSIIIKGYECTAGLDCFVRVMSIGYKYRCVTHWEYRELCGLNNDGTTIVPKRVAIADGCNCTIRESTICVHTIHGLSAI